MTAAQALLVATPGVPAVMFLLWLWPRARPVLPGLLWLAPLPGLAAALLAAGAPPLVVDPTRLRFTLVLDAPGALLLGACALLWSAAGLYARAYLGTRWGGRRFAAWWLITQAGSLGLFVSGDLLTFYFLFTAASLPAYGLIAHDGTPPARRAAAITLLLAVLGEFAMLLGFVLLSDAVPGKSVALADVMAALRPGKAPNFALALLLAGFGLKAGLVPLHVWLPLAHPAAPVPASAVLSGALVKAGIIGLLRFFPLDGSEAGWGALIVVIGFVTAFWGVVCGVVQRNPKVVLAYSTISQMGLAAAAFGMGVALGRPEAAMAVAFLAMAHVLAKGALFLAVGCGARRWLVLAPALVLALGFGGLPLTGGALGKAATKGLLEGGVTGVLAVLSAIGSTALMLHFMRRLAATEARPAHPVMLLSWLGLAAAALVLPWLLYAPCGFGDPWETLSLIEFRKAALPVLVGAALAVALDRWSALLPAIPEGDLLVPAERVILVKRGWADRIAAAEAILRTWPAAGLALLLLGAAFAAALLAGRG